VIRSPWTYIPSRRTRWGKKSSEITRLGQNGCGRWRGWCGLKLLEHMIQLFHLLLTNITSTLGLLLPTRGYMSQLKYLLLLPLQLWATVFGVTCLLIIIIVDTSSRPSEWPLSWPLPRPLPSKSFPWTLPHVVLPWTVGAEPSWVSTLADFATLKE